VTGHYSNFVVGGIIGWSSSVVCASVYGAWLVFCCTSDECHHFKTLLLQYLVPVYVGSGQYRVQGVHVFKI